MDIIAPKMSSGVVDQGVSDGTVQAKTAPLSRMQLIIVLAVGVVFSVQTLMGLVPLNGAVRYHSLDFFRTMAAMIGPLLVVGWVAWRVDGPRPGKWFLLGLLTAANLALQILGTVADPRGTGLIREIMLSPGATSYFNDALLINSLPDFLSHYHQATLTLHGLSHPAGPIVFLLVLYQTVRRRPGRMALRLCAGDFRGRGSPGHIRVRGLVDQRFKIPASWPARFTP